MRFKDPEMKKVDKPGFFCFPCCSFLTCRRFGAQKGFRRGKFDFFEETSQKTFKNFFFVVADFGFEMMAPICPQ